MQQPQNNSLPSNQGSELQVQQLRTKLSYRVLNFPFVPTTTHKSEPHLKQTQSKQTDTTRNQSQLLFGCLRQGIVVNEIIVVAPFTSVFSPSRSPKKEKVPPLSSTSPHGFYFLPLDLSTEKSNTVLHQGVVACPLHN
jgi:hypothetical protein